MEPNRPWHIAALAPRFRLKTTYNKSYQGTSMDGPASLEECLEGLNLIQDFTRMSLAHTIYDEGEPDGT